jgi:DNA-binding LacI/PurR family transcriptional regulator
MTMMTMTTLTNCKARRLSQKILDDIDDGLFKRGELLPAENTLAGHYNVSRSTIRRAISYLSSQKKLQKLPQRGAQVPLHEQALRSRGSDDRPNGSTSRTITLAAVWAAVPNYHITKMREGMQRYALENDLDFRIFLSPKGHEQALDVLEHIQAHGVNGVAVLPYPGKQYHDLLERLCRDDFPLVSLISIEDLPISSVETDSFSSLYLTTHHLLERYRRPVYFLAMPEVDTVIRDRYCGYRKAMQDAGFTQGDIGEHTLVQKTTGYDPEYWGEEKGWLPAFEVVDALLRRTDEPLSIACMNDGMARAVYKAAEKHGRTIGPDLAVTGVDDMPMASFLQPGLTSISSPPDLQGYEVAQLLHRTIEGKVDQPVHIQMPVELIERESS